MQWNREQYLDLMTFGHAPRPMFVEMFGPLVGLDREWRAQGATEEEINMVAFDWDYIPATAYVGNCFPRLAASQIIEDNDEYRIERDGLGRTMKLLKATATVPLPLDFPVKNMDDWLTLKPLFVFDENRISQPAIDAARQKQTQGHLVLTGIPGAFDMARELMGEEVACMAYYDQPELMQDILDTISETSFQVLQRVSEKITIDALAVHEDFAGKSGPLAGPVHVEQYFKPYYLRIWNLLRSRGTRIFQQDTDGNVNPVMPALLDCGLTCIFPMEPAAGMDMVELRKKHGQRLAMMGGLDKHVLRQDKAAIRRELEYKLQPIMRKGTVFGLDHRIPNGTPLENYRYYVDLGREILGLPPRRPECKGWGRMAF